MTLPLFQNFQDNFNWDTNDLSVFSIRFAINIVFLFLIIRFLYYPKTKRKDYLFTYFIIGIITFILCFCLNKLNIEIGMGLGLFAIFGIIRYRTDAIEIKEMTYLFLIIGLSVVNALLATEKSHQINLLELGMINTVVLVVLYVLENLWLMKHESRKVLTYDRVDLLNASQYEEMKADLEAKTGLIINRFEIGRINFLNDTVQVRLFYYADDQGFSNYGAD